MKSILNSYQTIGIDTMVFIYLLEDHPIFAEISANIFECVESGKVSGITSVITLLEIAVKPKRDKNKSASDDYRRFISNFPNLEIIDVNDEICEIASTLRADYNLKTPDAIQIATSIEMGASVFITNDKMLNIVDDIEILLLTNIINK
ncbi:MAG: PIN domain-containing protein [Methanosarcinaceae archaeon]|nr:PIN domain-containing protein [Methanosarcinaceae archaeon]